MADGRRCSLEMAHGGMTGFRCGHGRLRAMIPIDCRARSSCPGWSEPKAYAAYAVPARIGLLKAELIAELQHRMIFPEDLADDGMVFFRPAIADSELHQAGAQAVPFDIDDERVVFFWSEGASGR
mgnify:CR=1 FL=1